MHCLAIMFVVIISRQLQLGDLQSALASLIPPGEALCGHVTRHVTREMIYMYIRDYTGQ